MNSKPMTYDSLKTVMEYLPFMKRMEMARRCPSLKNVEKVVPLRLDSVCFNEHVEVDDTVFQLHLVQKCPEGVPVPKCFQHGYDGVLDNLDQHGCPDFGDINSWTDGDIVRRDHDEEEAEDPITDLREVIEEMKAELPEDGGLLEDLNKIEAVEVDLQSYMNRRDNIMSPYQLVYRLKIVQKGQEIECYYSDVDMPFSLKLKQLCTFLFGGRKPLILVNYLAIRPFERTIRMPPGPLFKIRKLDLGQLVNNVIPAESAIHNSSFPLEVLWVQKFHPRDINCPIVRDAKELFISNLCDQPVVDFVITNLHSNCTILHVSGEDVSYENVVEIITQVLARSKDFYLKLEFSTPPDFMQRLDDIKNQFQADQGNDFIAIPMTDDDDLSLIIHFDDTNPSNITICTVD